MSPRHWGDVQTIGHEILTVRRPGLARIGGGSQVDDVAFALWHPHRGRLDRISPGGCYFCDRRLDRTRGGDRKEAMRMNGRSVAMLLFALVSGLGAMYGTTRLLKRTRRRLGRDAGRGRRGSRPEGRGGAQARTQSKSWPCRRRPCPPTHSPPFKTSKTAGSRSRCWRTSRF